MFLSMTQQPLMGQRLVINDASRSHPDTPQSVEFLWTSDQPDAETSTSQHTTLTSDRNPCCRRDSNPQFQQASKIGRIRAARRLQDIYFLGEIQTQSIASRDSSKMLMCTSVEVVY